MPWLEWYNSLAKPSWTPAPTTIGLIWQILYPIILVSFGYTEIPAAELLPDALIDHFRRFRSGGFTVADLVASGSWPERIAGLIAQAIDARANVLVSGGTGSGSSVSSSQPSSIMPRTTPSTMSSMYV